MSVTQQPPSGWYADPEYANGERYWSGAAWSDQRRPRAAMSTSTATQLSPPVVRPVRNDVDYYIIAGQKPRGGRLLLYPDRIVHVDSKLPQHLGLLPLLLVRLLSRWIAKVRAAKRVAAGDPAVVTVPLMIVSQIQTQKRTLGQSLIITTTTGVAHQFTDVHCDMWATDLAAALTAEGRNVSPTTVGLSVT